MILGPLLSVAFAMALYAPHSPLANAPEKVYQNCPCAPFLAVGHYKNCAASVTAAAFLPSLIWDARGDKSGPVVGDEVLS